jgi:integrase
MSRTRQSGHLYRKGGNWCLRYYDLTQEPDGTIRRPQRSRILVEAAGQYRSKKAAQVLADEFLAPFNNGTITTQSCMSVVQFWEKQYLPYVQAQKRPSTAAGYEQMWNRYLEARLAIAMREFRTADCEHMLEEIAVQYKVSTTTLEHIKHLMSGIFRYALRMGVLNGVNPVQSSCLPKARPAGATHAYTISQILAIIDALPLPARAMISIAAFAGLRKGEMRGLRPTDYDGSSLMISRSAWKKHIGPPKGRRGSGAVPLIPTAAKVLDEYLSTMPVRNYIFETFRRGPGDLDYMVREVIRPALKAKKLPWYGLHAFRRGLATNLHELGVADIVIQSILRHSDVSVTRQAYIKSDGVDSRSLAAMQRLELAICTKHAPVVSGATA